MPGAVASDGLARRRRAIGSGAIARRWAVNSHRLPCAFQTLFQVVSVHHWRTNFLHPR
jgi:hypothetical protein